MDIPKHNKAAWNKQALEGCRWSQPVDAETVNKARNGKIELVLTPKKLVPMDWFGEIKNKEILCLASGGGQQVPVLAAAGARVVSFDNSDEQLKRDQLVADREHLTIETVQGDMADLSIFDNSRFDLIFHPVSNVFVSDVNPVWKECYRVLKPGGHLLSGIMNPVFYLFDSDESFETGELKVKYKLPYSDLESLDPEKLKEFDQPLEFGHLLEDQIGGQIKAGFVITGFYEDWWEDEASLLNKHCPTFMATKGTKVTCSADLDSDP